MEAEYVDGAEGEAEGAVLQAEARDDGGVAVDERVELLVAEAGDGEGARGDGVLAAQGPAYGVAVGAHLTRLYVMGV